MARTTSGPVTALAAYPLMFIAEYARDLIPADVDDRTPGQYQALIAIVFAAASAEAFMNDLGDVASLHAAKGRSGKLGLLARVLKDLEEHKSSVVFKLEMAHLVLTGRPMDRGGIAHQDLRLLIRLRNLVIHAKPDRSLGINDDGEFVVAKVSDLLRELDSRGLLGDDELNFPTDRAATRATARWACHTARQSVGSLKGLLPTGRLRRMIVPIFYGFSNDVPKPGSDDLPIVGWDS